jgi:arsenite/tail-anchored protein-transporting ATPase
VQELFAKRALLVTGKGGVGRTTLTAALAMAAARSGKRVLIAEMGEPEEDLAALGRLFGRQTLPADPVPLARNVDGVMLWSRKGHERFLSLVLPVAALVRAALRSKGLRRMFDAAPSLNELGVFYHMLTLARERRPGGGPAWDLMIVDLPATGHALGLATLPDRVLQLLPTGPIARAIHEGKDVFFDERLSAMIVATLPEQLPVTECLELLEGLRETDMPIGGVIVNKVVGDDFTADERDALAPVVARRPVFGATRFLGIGRMAESVAQLQAEAQAPVWRVPELPLEGAGLIHGLSDAILDDDVERGVPDDAASTEGSA